MASRLRQLAKSCKIYVVLTIHHQTVGNKEITDGPIRPWAFWKLLARCIRIDGGSHFILFLDSAIPPEEGTDVFQVGTLQGIVLRMQPGPGGDSRNLRQVIPYTTNLVGFLKQCEKYTKILLIFYIFSNIIPKRMKQNVKNQQKQYNNI